MAQRVDVVVRLEAPPGTADDQLEAATEDLVDHVLEQSDVHRAPGQLDGPPLQKSGIEALELGVAILSVLAELPALYDLVKRARSWNDAERRYRLRLEIDGNVLEVDSASEEDIRRLLKRLLRRH